MAQDLGRMLLQLIEKLFTIIRSIWTFKFFTNQSKPSESEDLKSEILKKNTTLSASWFSRFYFNSAYVIHNDDLTKTEPSIDYSTLFQLCCKRIITREAQYLKKNYIYLPTNRFSELMLEALRCECYENATILMSHWPFKTFSVIEMIPNVLGNKHWLRDVAVARLHLIVQMFFNIAEEESSLRLRVLDLRGVVLGDDMLYFLIRQICSQKLSIRTLIRQIFALLTTDLEEDDYRIIADCDLISMRTAKELMKLLKMESDSRLRIHLNIASLDVSYLSPAKSYELLTLINSTEPKLPTFRKLTSSVRFGDPRSPKNRTKTILRRLEIKKWEKNISKMVPSYIIHKLEYLDISSLVSKNIIEDDFQYLISITSRLRGLDLSRNIVTETQINLWRDLLRSMAPTLTFLNMAGCLINDSQLSSIVTFILRMSNLTSLNFRNNSINMDTKFEHVLKLGSMPRLKRIQLSHKFCTGWTVFQNSANEWSKQFDRLCAMHNSAPLPIQWY